MHSFSLLDPVTRETVAEVDFADSPELNRLLDPSGLHSLHGFTGQVCAEHVDTAIAQVC